MFGSKTYSLYKSKEILKNAYSWYKKKRHTLDFETLQSFNKLLHNLDQAILNKEKKKACNLAKEIETLCHKNFKKSTFTKTFEFILAIAFALVIATFVRQIWFELYEIPTGSMRPTYKEKDNLLVSKTTFGINTPLKTSHLYFNPSLVKRTGVLIFSGEHLDLPGTDTTYFWIFPYTKRYIKRLIGKPGDTLYFYGGKIYGLDKKGNQIKELLESDEMKPLEHIPFLSFEGKKIITKSESSNQVTFYHMNQPIGRLTISPFDRTKSEIKIADAWNLIEAKSNIHYYDIFGIKNFAMARLLSKEQVLPITGIDPNTLEEGVLYLELRHHPSLIFPPPYIIYGFSNRPDVILNPQVTIIPLTEGHLKKIFENLYTARFVVKNKKVARYSTDRIQWNWSNPKLDIPDGVYEFDKGKAIRIGFGGTPHFLDKEHPIYSFSPERVKTFFNLGIEFATPFSPKTRKQLYYPSRYAYFREGDLYLLGAPIIKKDDPYLISFIEREKKKAKNTTSLRPYIPFQDYGPPTAETIKTFGVKVPEKHYFVLGDNHAMSADSRYFGFVPEDNLQGTPTFILWPFGPRFGYVNSGKYPFISPPGIAIWALAFLVLLLWYLWRRHQLNQSIFKNKK